MTGTSIPAGARIGHVHLKVADLERAIGFYRDYLGFDLLFNLGSAAFLSAGGYHYHIGINYPERKDLATALKRLLDHGWSIDGASDHGTHEAIYLHDPDFNGIELAWDRHPSQWPRRDGALTFSRQPLASSTAAPSESALRMEYPVAIVPTGPSLTLPLLAMLFA